MILAHVNQLLAQYGYDGLFAVVFVAALGIGAPIPVQAILLALGALSATQGGPDFAALAACGLAGAVGGHTALYTTGRLGSRWVDRLLDRIRKNTLVSGLLAGASRARSGYAALTFISRFALTPVASPISLLAGVSHMRAGLYLTLEVLGEAIYVLGLLSLGRIFGVRLLEQSATLPLFGLLIAAAILLPIALARLASYLLNRGHSATPAHQSTHGESGTRPGTSRA